MKSRAAAALDDQLAAWLNRKFGAYPYVFLDARYENVRHGGLMLPCAVFITVGIDRNGKRDVLGLSVSLSEQEIHWRQFLNILKDRGLHTVSPCLFPMPTKVLTRQDRLFIFLSPGSAANFIYSKIPPKLRA